ncbi:universal stress protein [Roseomonas sp. AR75]|uniref:universal stress protein n=1 Tax=Roseomonas sp. AR75 TaxID=2562311 RepID=UPI0014858365|nr:universal stress protein [Roseomonas sp. AR75]
MHAYDASTPLDIPPRGILLATDLSCRCDRAQDRAVRLAERWGATLHLLHVVEHAAALAPAWRHGRPAREVLAERRLRAATEGRAVRAELLLRQGSPPSAILDAAQETACDVIVAGIARGDTIGRAILGSTVERLVHRAPMPVLVVKNRAERDYDRLVVATDFSPSSAQALRQALRLFPDARKTLLHAYRVPFEGFISKDANREEMLGNARQRCATFLADAAIPQSARDGLDCRIEYGSPDDLIAAHVWDADVDLAVVGTHGSSGVFDILIGSTAERLLEYLPCDVLVVREPRSLPAMQPATAGAAGPGAA